MSVRRFSDEMWARIPPAMPPTKGPMRPFRPHPPIVEAAIYRRRTGIACRGLPRVRRAHAAPNVPGDARPRLPLTAQGPDRVSAGQGLVLLSRHSVRPKGLEPLTF